MARFAYLLPAFATDFSASMSLIASIGGMSALHAPSGCMGNYCSFDELDWIRNPGMTYCSMLREDETIFGNDDLLLNRIETACKSMHPPFVAIIGSPITALIGTDLHGIAELSEEMTGIPTIGVDTTGFGTYQDGLLKAFMECTDKLTSDGAGGGVNILGMDKYDYHTGDDRPFLESMARDVLKNYIIRMPEDGLDFFKGLEQTESSFAVSTAGLRMAAFLKKRFGTPYEILTYRDAKESKGNGKRCLILGDQVMSNYLRGRIESEIGHEADVGTLFGLERSISRQNDFSTDSEDVMIERIREGRYDAVICDPIVAGLVPEGTKTIQIPHSAVSSKVHWNGFIPLNRAFDVIIKAL